MTYGAFILGEFFKPYNLMSEWDILGPIANLWVFWWEVTILALEPMNLIDGILWDM